MVPSPEIFWTGTSFKWDVLFKLKMWDVPFELLMIRICSFSPNPKEFFTNYTSVTIAAV